MLLGYEFATTNKPLSVASTAGLWLGVSVPCPRYIVENQIASIIVRTGILDGLKVAGEPLVRGLDLPARGRSLTIQTGGKLISDVSSGYFAIVFNPPIAPA